MLKRKTAVSSCVLSALKESDRALSVPQLLRMLAKKNLTPNKSTVYRIIDKLVSQQSVSMVTIQNGVSYYEFSDHHHHHFFDENKKARSKVQKKAVVRC